jgi:hypothetical protein
MDQGSRVDWIKFLEDIDFKLQKTFIELFSGPQPDCVKETLFIIRGKANKLKIEHYNEQNQLGLIKGN